MRETTVESNIRPLRVVQPHQSGSTTAKPRPSILVALASIALAAAACAAPASSDSTDIDATPSAAVSSGTVDVTVVTYLAHNTIMELTKDGAGNPDACAISTREVLDRAGDTIELRVAGEETARTAELEPAVGNGAELPCILEATFSSVPADATSLTATQIGGEHSGLYTQTVSGTQLAAENSTIALVPKDEPLSTDDLIAATCLEGKVVKLRVHKNYSEYSGLGEGDDIWVENQTALTNNCGKAIKAAEYSIAFDDVFGETILTCSEKVTMKIAAGATRKSPANRGCLVDTYDDNFMSWDTASPEDITSSVVVKSIVFADGTRLSSGL